MSLDRLRQELGEPDIESHDRLIATVLGLSHALNVAFFTALAESGADAPLLTRLSSTTFDAQLGIASQVAAENPHLYYEIQSLTDAGARSDGASEASAVDVTGAVSAVERLRSIVGKGDETGFVRLMERGRAYLAGRERLPEIG